jgi:hypothetical protein
VAFLQENYGAGIYRGRSAPADSVFDAVNALVNDEGLLFRRGGSTYYSASDAGSTLTRLDALYYQGINAPRVTMHGGTSFYAMNGTTPVVIGTITQPGRPASLGGMAVFPIAAGGRLVYYAGSLKTATYQAGTISTTADSAVVTGAGTAFLANVDAGMMMRHSGDRLMIPVKSVDSDTQLTLVSPWPSTQSTAIFLSFSGLPRLLVALGNRIYESKPGDAFTIDAFDMHAYHELPSNAEITGIEGVGDQALVFTTAGVWRLNNLSLDIVDDYGNVSQQVELVSGDIVLWGDLGVASWAGNVVAPALDDIYLIGPDGGLQTLTDAIRPLYRSYVAAGYSPGRATVRRGHLFLPVLNGTTVVDELVCRLDRPFQTPSGRVFRPWTRWAGHGAAVGRATMAASGSAPKLLGIKGQRVLDMTTSLNATGSTQDADATTPVFTVDTVDFDTGPGIRPNTTEKVRAVYETTGGTPTITVKSAVGPESASWTTATTKRGGGASDGTDYSAFKVNRKAERIRFRFECSSQVTSLILRRFPEITVRQAGQN